MRRRPPRVCAAVSRGGGLGGAHIRPGQCSSHAAGRIAHQALGFQPSGASPIARQPLPLVLGRLRRVMHRAEVVRDTSPTLGQRRDNDAAASALAQQPPRRVTVSLQGWSSATRHHLHQCSGPLKGAKHGNAYHRTHHRHRLRLDPHARRRRRGRVLRRGTGPPALGPQTGAQLRGVRDRQPDAQRASTPRRWASSTRRNKNHLALHVDDVPGGPPGARRARCELLRARSSTPASATWPSSTTPTATR